jgi:predicted dehydrogenase
VCDVEGRKLSGDWSGVASNIDTGAARHADLSSLRTYSSYDDLLKDDGVDLVDVCLPTFLHAEMALRSFKAGKHVVCEKPMGRTSREARRMAVAAGRAGRFLGVGHVLRFWPEYVAMKEMIDSGRYGAVRSAHFSRFSPRPERSWNNWLQDPSRSGSAVLDLHIHDTDAVQWFFGRPAKVTSRGTFDAAGGVSHILSAFDCEGGAMIVAEAGWDFPPSFPFRMTARVIFEEAAAEFDSTRTPTLIVHNAKTGEVEAPAFPQVNAYAEELRYFVRCIAEGRPPERITPADAAAAIAIVEAEIKSARSGRAVKVEV